MEKDIKTLLDEEISDELNDLGELERGSDSYKIAVDGVVKLMDKKIEIEKLERDAKVKDRDYELECRKVNGELSEKAKSREIEKKKLEQITNEKKDQLFKNGIAIANLVLPLGITIWGTLVTFKFEETGTVTTSLGKGHIKNLMFRK